MIPKPEEHYLKNVIKARKLRYWQLKSLLGINESKMSRCLNGIEPMPDDMEEKLINFLRIFENADTIPNSQPEIEEERPEDKFILKCDYLNFPKIINNDGEKQDGNN